MKIKKYKKNKYNQINWVTAMYYINKAKFGNKTTHEARADP